MNPRLDELLRQRELLRQHLRWIEREIEAAGAPKPAADTTVGAAAPTNAGSPSSGALNLAESKPAAPAEAMAESAPATVAPPLPDLDSRGLHADVRRGCLLYFLAAFGALGAVIGYVIWRY